MMYASLITKSNFSFLEGASHPHELVERAATLGLRALALTDRDGVYGAVRAHVAAKEHNLHLIHGATVTIRQADHQSLTLLVQTREGYANLCRLLTRGRLRHKKGMCSVTWDEVCSHAEGVIALIGVRDTRPGVPQAIINLKSAFGDRLYGVITRHREREDVHRERLLRELASEFGFPLAAATEVLYHRRSRRRLQDVLTCIRHGTTLEAAGTLLQPNAEHCLNSCEAFAALFADIPEAVSRTIEIAERCTFSMDELCYRYPVENLPSGMRSIEYLRKLTLDGAARRYPEGIPADVMQQIERELQLVEDLDYCGYFLTMWEIVQYCREHNILCQGRGSAANSAVCYCLAITAVDPVRMGLLFERFISRERAEPPDIDLDIEHQRREEVIQYVYNRYGRTHAAMVANVIRYRTRSSVRDIGKALGIAETTLVRTAKLVGYGKLEDEVLQQAGFDMTQRSSRLFVELVEELYHFPRHLSVHCGGFLIGHEPVHDLVPLENAAMEGRTVIQWDKNDIEDLGLFKVDLLSLGSLHAVHRCFDLVREHYQADYTMSTVPADDPATFEMISRGDTIGLFQIESRAQMSVLPRMRPKKYYDLVIQISLIRPGPIVGDMVHPYLRRRNGEEAIDYPHPRLEPVLRKTLGIPLFQEQVMRVAMLVADYSAGEADQLRRDMAAWRRSGRIEAHRERLISRMRRNGISAEFAERVFQQISGFAEYGFPESHAASFALIAYVTAWQKCHYPAAYICALLNAQPMGFYSIATIIEDGKHHGVEVRPIDILRSHWDCTLESGASGGWALRIGLRFVNGLGTRHRQRLETAMAAGPFRSLDDFSARTGLDHKAVTRLAKSGAFEQLADRAAPSQGQCSTSRRSAMWELRGLARAPRLELINPPSQSPDFDGLSVAEEIIWDYSAASHSTRGHPMDCFRDQLEAEGMPSAAAVKEMENGSRASYIGMLICQQRPSTASGVVFMTMEDETGFVNLILWPSIFAANKLLLTTATFLGVAGVLQVQDEVLHIIADSFWRPELGLTPAAVEPRRFR
jgi:error-prone DNA polymerase